MQVDCALLCDAVTIRDGLLNVLGGGVSRLQRPGPFPASLGVSLAVRVMVHPTEVDRQHECRVLVNSQDGKAIADLGISFQVPGPPDGALEPGEEIAVVFPVNLLPVGVPGPGGYSVEILIDGIHQRSVPFRVLLPVE